MLSFTLYQISICIGEGEWPGDVRKGCRGGNGFFRGLAGRKIKG